LKVLHVIPSVAVVHGGPSVALRRMSRALADQGMEVDIATTDDGGPGRHAQVPLGEPTPFEGGRAFYFRKQTEFYKASWPLWRWLRQQVRHYDLLHIHALFSFSSIAAAYAARRAGVPYVLRPLGTLSPYGMTQRRPFFKQLSLACLEGPLLRDAAAVHFTSSQEAQEASDLQLPLRGRVIPLGLPPASPGDAAVWPRRLGLPEGATCLVFLSRLDPKKNLPGLIGAAALLQRRGHILHWLIGGDGPAEYLSQLQQQAADAGVSHCVHWLGRVDGQDKADLLAAGQMFVLPSFAENFGIAVAEALSAGLPCVVGEGVALAQAVAQHGAGIVVGTDPQSIASGVETLLADASRRSEAAAAARHLAASEYSQDVMGHRLVALYQDILRDRGKA
jgi:glycosyltransferase involved in cell wall biosynthesis